MVRQIPDNPIFQEIRSIGQFFHLSTSHDVPFEPAVLLVKRYRSEVWIVIPYRQEFEQRLVLINLNRFEFTREPITLPCAGLDLNMQRAFEYTKPKDYSGTNYLTGKREKVHLHQVIIDLQFHTFGFPLCKLVDGFLDFFVLGIGILSNQLIKHSL